MRVFVFDLMPYKENLEHVKGDARELPWPLSKRHFKPEAAAATYAEHLECWDELEPLGYDGLGVNEHHTSPYGLMNSPNLIAAAVAQRTTKLKILLLGNLLPIHDPLRLAEELAMLDCLSQGRIISGFARGIPRELEVFGVPLPEARARFEEAFEVIRGAWTEEVFDFEGRFWSYHDVALWPRPLQQPHPPVWIPITSSRESIEWAAGHDLPIIPGAMGGLQQDIVRHYEEHLERHGHHRTPDHVIVTADAHVASSTEEAVSELAPYRLYFSRTLFSHGNITEANLQQQAGYLSSTAFDYVRPENMPLVARAREDYRDLTLADIERQAERAPWGPPEVVAQRIIAAADRVGANTVLVSLNRGGTPKEMFLEQIRRFGAEVLPALHAHQPELSSNPA